MFALGHRHSPVIKLFFEFLQLNRTTTQKLMVRENFLILGKRKNCTDKKPYDTVICYRWLAGVAEWYRRWAADPLYVGSIPTPGSNLL